MVEINTVLISCVLTVFFWIVGYSHVFSKELSRC